MVEVKVRVRMRVRVRLSGTLSSVETIKKKMYYMYINK
jgi:hypothetical protein